jgi:nucleoside-diphosphate-sugar epimerase
VKDVLVAFEIILSNLNPQEGTFEEFEIGSGYPVKVKTVVETVHRLTRSTSKLNFGARPHASTDFEFEKAVTTKLLNLGWYASVKLEDGLASYLD